jgi:hypothetical protein
VASIIGATTNTANTLMSAMAAYGILAKITGERQNRLIVFSECIELFRK